MARAMAAALAEFEVPSAADVLGRLRQAFPLAPLERAGGGARHHDGAQLAARLTDDRLDLQPQIGAAHAIVGQQFAAAAGQA